MVRLSLYAGFVRLCLPLAALAFGAHTAAQPASQPTAPPQSAEQPCAEETCTPSNLVYFGTRGEGPDSGITAARFDPKTGKLTALGLAARIANPTWLIPSPHRAMVYAVSEVGNDGSREASVHSFGADPKTGALAQISKVGSGGGGATHLTLNARVMPPSIVVSNYGSGTVGVVPLGKEGVLGEVTSVQTEKGSGPSPRQASAHPHGSAVDPTGKFVLVSDLGADRIFVYRYDPQAQALAGFYPPSVPLKAGSGPRHIVFHPGGRFVYVNDELSGEITTLLWNPAAPGLTFAGYTPTRGKGYTKDLSSAELALSESGRFLYLSNRGEDVLVVYAVNNRTGSLREIQRIASGGKSPVTFAADPSGRWLAVANQGSDLISIFAIDAKTGKLAETRQNLSVPHPASIAFLLR